MLKNLQILRGYLFPNVHFYIGLRFRVGTRRIATVTKQYSALLWSPLSRARGKSRWRGQPGTCRALPPGWQGRTVEIWPQIDIESMLKTQSYLRIITFGFHSSTPIFQLLVTWVLNMHQEKKITYGKFFNFRAQNWI